MPAASWLEYVRAAHLDRSRTDRIIYREIKRLRPQRIVELGITTKNLLGHCRDLLPNPSDSAASLAINRDYRSSEHVLKIKFSDTFSNHL